MNHKPAQVQVSLGLVSTQPAKAQDAFDEAVAHELYERIELWHSGLDKNDQLFFSLTLSKSGYGLT